MEGNSPTSSTDSWMFVKSDKIGFGNDPVEKEEDSDGISVISESEMTKNNLNHPSDDDSNTEKPIVEEIDGPSSEECEEAKEVELLTPPATPSVEVCEEKREKATSKELELHQETQTSTAKEPHSHGAVFLVAMALIIALLYSNISTLKREIAATASIYEQRIARLEEENQQLKNQLSQLIKQMKPKEEILMPSKAENVDKVLLDQKFIERQEPITKDVWLGGEKEDVVKILDKKLNSLPDYCYFTDETDLFYDYNKEICERKKRKLEDRVKKFHDKNGKHVDDELMTKKRKQLNEIKKPRVSISITDNDEEIKTVDIKEEKIDKNNFEEAKKRQKRNDEKQENIRKRKVHHGKEKNVGEWNDRRTVGREEARKRHESQENWFLKRKNEREIHRLEKNVHH